MAKTPEMEQTLSGISKALFGRERSDTQCVTCGSTRVTQPEDFRDALSWKEFGISHMCQSCQDEVFGA